MSEPQSTIDRVRGGLFYFVCALILIYLIAPIIVVVPLSFTSDNFLIYPIHGLSLRWYDDFMSNPRWLASVWNSVTIGITVMMVSTILGTSAALGMDQLGLRFRRAGTALVMLPVVIPIVITGSSLYFVLRALKLTNTFTGMVVAHCVIAVPFVVLTVSATLRNFDHDLMRAAISLGASPAAAFRRIMLPLIMPGVVSGGLFAFATSFDEVVLALMVAGPTQRTLPLQMFDGLREHLSPTLTAAASLLILLSMLLIASIEVVRRRAKRKGVGVEQLTP
jgi:putative spermidine/putrescine transport system permease protein